jgi:bifunctional non-homologous end joining protein LigD
MVRQFSIETHRSIVPAGFVEPCLPISAPSPPSDDSYVHEIKHDGLRVIARKIGSEVTLYGRSGDDLTQRFPLIVGAIAGLGARSCIIDGEAVACGDDGIACFDLIRRSETNESAFMWAFDLIEVNGADLRRDPLEARKAALRVMLGRASMGACFNEHLEGDGAIVFQHACKLGLEGIISKRKNSRYISGRSLHWIKSSNANAPAMKREAEDNWGR